MNQVIPAPSKARQDRFFVFKPWLGRLAVLKAVPVLGLLFLALAFPKNLQAQYTLIWEEVFNESNGATSGTASGVEATAWTTSGHTISGFIQVNSGNQRLQGSNLDQQETWSTGPIDISSYSSISVFMNIGEDGSAEVADDILCQYSFNGTTWTTLTDGSQSGNFTAASPYATGLSGTNLYLRVIMENNESNETLWLDNIKIYSISCASGPVTLPFTEDFETVGPTTTYTTNQSGINGLCYWSYDKTSNGRLQFTPYNNTSGGSRAAAFDANPTGTVSDNNLIATLDISDYSCSGDLELSFWHLNYGDEDQANDRVWVRGSSSDSWIEIYDLFDNQGASGAWVQVTGLDIDAAIFGAGQTITSTFQVRFGQGDDFSFTNDGRAFDDISISGTTSPVPQLFRTPTSLDFGYVVTGGTSAEMTYSLTGNCLSPASGNIVVTAPSNFEVSLTSGSGFGSSVNVPYSGATLVATTIYVRFKPTTSNTNYSGDISNSGGGASAKTVAVTGTTIISGSQVFTTSTTFEVPAGVYCVDISVWGGGGGGGETNNSTGGGGGGGGGYAGGTIAVNPGDDITVSVGSGGTGSSTTANGSPGNPSSAAHTSGTITATGGGGGETESDGGEGGAGGSGSFTGSVTNQVLHSGGIGGDGDGQEGGGGGGGAGDSENGGNGDDGSQSTHNGGAGGDNNDEGGGEGNGGFGGNDASGQNGFTYGGGGGGVGDDGGTAGNGAAGAVIITWGNCTPPCPAYDATIDGDVSICTGGSTNLTVTLSSGASPYTVVYTDGLGNTTTLINYTSGSDIPVNPTSTRTYTLVSVTDNSGCLASSLMGSAVVTVNPNVTPSISIAANPGNTICAGTNVTFTATASNTGGGTVTYDFKVNGGSVQTGASNTYASMTLANNDQVTCDISISGGACLTATTASSNTITMTVNALPTANAGAPLAAFCQGGTSAALGGSVGGSATGGTWDDGGVGGAFTPSATDLNATWTPPANYSGTATLTLTTSGGSCGTAMDSKTQLVHPRPTAVTCTPVDDLCQTGMGSVTIEVSGGTPPYEISWAQAGGTPASPQTLTNNPDMITINDLIGGTTYIFVVEDDNGCQAQ